MELTCPNCGATNRSTSRFCARCGTALPRREPAADQQIDLPWLQAVEDRAVKETTSLPTGQPPQPPAEQQQPQQAQPAPAGEQPQPLPKQTAPLPPEYQSAVRPAQPEGEAQQEPPAKPEGPPAPDEPPPPWVVSILEPQTEPPRREEGYEPEELAHIMPWVHGAPTEEEGEGDAAGPPAHELPPWLGDVTVQETLEGMPPVEAVELPTDLELEGVAPFEVPAEPSAAPPPEEHVDTVPDWLRALPGVPDVPREPSLHVGTLTPTLAGEGSGSLSGQLAREVPVRPPRPGSVETLAALLQPAAPEATRRRVPGTGLLADPARRRVPGLLTDRIIYLVILAALLAVVIARLPFGQIPAPPAPGVIEFYNAVETAPSGAPVLVVYDWDASRSAEMSVLAKVVTHHIMSRKLPFVTVSTAPQGPGFAQQVTDSLVSDETANYGYRYGEEYLVLGYLPGNEAALSALSTDIRRALPLDYVQGNTLDSFGLMQDGSPNRIQDFSMVVLLASSESDMLAWIGQVAARTDMPVVAAVPQSLEPLARPFVGVPVSGLDAVISGPSGAYQYARQLELNGRGAGPLGGRVDLDTQLTAQSVAQVLVALAIVGGFVAYGTRRIFRRQG
ncbi:MAG TPA: zinc ribbon domain-containing protein [Chloroflexia bacterium]|nr:zinc ribbon domain-containing protein [Chloroflexia bacterium]